MAPYIKNTIASSHDIRSPRVRAFLDEAETMCDCIGLLHDGRLVAEGGIEDLRTRSGEQRLSSIFLKIIHADEKVEAIVP